VQAAAALPADRASLCPSMPMPDGTSPCECVDRICQVYWPMLAWPELDRPDIAVRGAEAQTNAHPL
jgi:hypothetical protein